MHYTDKPQNTDNPGGLPEAQPDKIKPLKIKAVNGFRARVKVLLKKWGLILGFGVAAGGYSGYKVREGYRDMTGYDPARSVVMDRIKNPEIADDRTEPITEGAGDENTSKNWLSKGKDAYKKAKKWAAKKIDKVNDTSKIARQYQEAKNGLKNAYQGILKFGDEAAFWGAFIMFFLAATMLASKLADIKKSLTQAIDPMVEKNMQTIVAKINEIGSKVNLLGERINNGDAVAPEEAKRLMDEFESVSAGLEEGSIGDED